MNIRKWIALIENVESGQRSWPNIVDNWNELDKKYRDLLQKEFPDPNEMLSLMTGGNPDMFSHAGVDDDGTIEIMFYNASEKVSSVERRIGFDIGNLHLTGLAIQEKYQNQGIGTRMLKDTIQVAKRLGLETVSSNAGGQAAYLYPRRGFQLDEPEYQVSKLKRESKQCMKENNVPKNAQNEIMKLWELMKATGYYEYLWKVQDHEYGFQALVPHCSFNCTFYLNDKECWKRLESK